MTHTEDLIYNNKKLSVEIAKKEETIRALKILAIDLICASIGNQNTEDYLLYQPDVNDDVCDHGLV